MKRLRGWAPALLWMGVIYAMSAMPGNTSGETSGRLTELAFKIISLLFGRKAAGISADELHLLIRKAAHMTEYAILFLLFQRALRMEGAKRPGLYALAMCAAYAGTDEFHQKFVDGRGPSVIDVGIDTLGAAIAWGMTRMISIIKRKRS
ncbi:MAG: VanZ family protein [Clostridia bacterium]|nr:VanZ family protein [Clostridia bacterium]